MKDAQCVRFLQWALPRLHLHWPGFRKVRRQACKRIARRLRDLGLADADDYRAYLEQHDEEWDRLDSLCRITISRFYRDRDVYATLAREVLPALARRAKRRDAPALRIWSAGCGSGEEPYTVRLVWALELEPQFPELAIEIIATDADPEMIRRARRACYGYSSLKDLPEAWRSRGFYRENNSYCLKPAYRRDIEFLQRDIRKARPPGRFDLVLCRNLVFTYFDPALQRATLTRLLAAMQEGGALVLGSHEKLPEGAAELSAWSEKHRIYRKGGRYGENSD